MDLSGVPKGGATYSAEAIESLPSRNRFRLWTPNRSGMRKRLPRQQPTSMTASVLALSNRMGKDQILS